MVNNFRARIIGLGSYLPDQVLSNTNLEKIVETTDEWITTRTGIKERRIALSECTSDLGAKAAQAALIDANVQLEDVDLILVATMSPDYIAPSTATVIQGKLGAFRAAAFDIQASCSGYLYGLSTAKAFVESGLYRTILFIAAEKMSAFIDYEDRNTCVLFGDGAAAAVVSAEGSGFEISSVCLGADGRYVETGLIPAGGAKFPVTQETIKDRMHYFRMQGKEVFKHAVRHMEQVAKECLLKAHVTEKQIGWIIPHQANARIMDALGKCFPKEAKIYRTIHKYGNTSASSIGIALDELVREHSLSKQEKILIVAFGVGFTWGATVLSKIDG
ncbi:3-oxoacyl-[acyl-carrier-protein] synthase 3 [Chlamydiales bacterium STE3]|nr:3-oxoacyl-[acyl-carrier-protein] synthase 3 [Chlamydiales bacterium STE3]